LLIAALAAPAGAFAQQPESAPPNRTASGDEKAAVADRPVSLDRIRRQLAATGPRTRSSGKGLKLEYYVDVYGRAPRIELFLPTENITSGPVKYGGMTHQEFLQVVTPEEFKSPPADIGAAVAALVKWLSEKDKRNGQTPKK
jgi:hypothetical protein